MSSAHEPQSEQVARSALAAAFFSPRQALDARDAARHAQVTEASQNAVNTERYVVPMKVAPALAATSASSAGEDASTQPLPVWDLPTQAMPTVTEVEFTTAGTSRFTSIAGSPSPAGEWWPVPEDGVDHTFATLPIAGIEGFLDARPAAQDGDSHDDVSSGSGGGRVAGFLAFHSGQRKAGWIEQARGRKAQLRQSDALWDDVLEAQRELLLQPNYVNAERLVRAHARYEAAARSGAVAA